MLILILQIISIFFIILAIIFSILTSKNLKEAEALRKIREDRKKEL